MPDLPSSSPLEVLAVATRLGVTSFGGPIAHLGYFREEYVARRKWLDDQSYAEIVALCQMLPGPASSQVGISIGLLRAGFWGGIAAWLGFTLPSAIALIAFAYGLKALGPADLGWLQGLKIVAVAVVAQAVWAMARTLSPDRPRIALTVLAAVGVLLAPGPVVQIAVIAGAGIIGWRLLSSGPRSPESTLRVPVRRGYAVVALALFAAMLLLLPVVRGAVESQAIALFDSFFRVGSLVFGGGHVVLPLLQREVVPPGWITNEQFVAGYGAAQAVPGPLFTFSAYLGATMEQPPNGWIGGLLALGAVFLPSFLLVIGGLPFWGLLRSRAGFQGALRGINAAVVGLLLAALYDPVWTSAIHDAWDFSLAVVAFALLMFWKAPPWIVVLLTGVAGAVMFAVD